MDLSASSNSLITKGEKSQERLIPMKQVWILNHYAQEPGGPGGTRHFSLARHLKLLGWQSTVMAGSVGLNSENQRLARHEKTRLDTFEEVPFLWVKTPSYRGNGVGRMINMLVYSIRVWLPTTTRKLLPPDVVVGSSVHPFAALSGALLAKRHGVPFVFEVRDLWPQTLVDMGRLNDTSLMARVLRLLELWLYRRADKIVVLLPKAVDYIKPLGIPSQNVVWIPNGVELEGYAKPLPSTQRDVFTLMYFGAHGQANGLDCVLEAMDLLSKMPSMQHVRLRLIGDGPLKPSLMAQATQLNLKNVQFEDLVPKLQIPKLASEADAFVICVKDLPKLYKYGISMNKLFDYFAASRPIIMASAAVNNPVFDAGAGFTVAPESSNEMAEAINKLVHLSQEQRNAMGEAGRAYAEKHHSFSALASKFASVFDQLVK
jgi:glycosyltransferase involved in cell wall biosynthesis